MIALMTYPEFWLRFLRAHSRRNTRALHYAGSTLALLCLAAGVLLDWRLLLAAPVTGYSFAWTAHLALEGNRPETFGHPLWSPDSDLRMVWLAIAGRLAPHLEQAGRERAGLTQAEAQHGPA